MIAYWGQESKTNVGSGYSVISAAAGAFEQIRGAVPASMHEALDDLASIVEERRELAAQRHMHHILHGWLLLHVPLSCALMLLAAWHAVFALRFVTPHW